MLFMFAVWVLGSGSFIFSHFLLDLHVDRTALDERPEDSDRDSFGFQLIDLPAEESGWPSDIFTVEPGESETDAEAGYFLVQAATGHEEVPASVSDDWYFSSTIPSDVSSDRLQLGGEPTSQPREDVKDRILPSFDSVSTSESICLPSYVADVCELPPHFEDETCHDESYVGGSASPPTASDDIPLSAFPDISSMHTASAGMPTSHLRTVETAILPPVEQTASSSLVTSPSIFLAAVEVYQSPEQLLSLSASEPVFGHPDVVCLEPSLESGRPIVVERQPTHGRNSEDQHVQQFGLEFPSQSDVEEIRQPDGTIVRRRVVRTSVRRVATRRVRRRQHDGRVVEFTETVELPGDDVGGGDSQLSELAAAASDPASEPGAPAAGQVVGVQTDTSQSDEPRVDTDVEVVRETLPDGRVVERRIVRTRQRRTVVKRVVVRPDRSKKDSA